jgi:hypothetical protein
MRVRISTPSVLALAACLLTDNGVDVQQRQPRLWSTWKLTLAVFTTGAWRYRSRWCWKVSWLAAFNVSQEVIRLLEPPGRRDPSIVWQTVFEAAAIVMDHVFIPFDITTTPPKVPLHDLSPYRPTLSSFPWPYFFHNA